MNANNNMQRNGMGMSKNIPCHLWLIIIVRKKQQEKKLRHVTSHICPDHPRCATSTKVVMWGGVPDLVSHAKFHQNRFRGFGFPRGRNLPLSYT